ncbi:MAG: hypothetical protein LBM77_13205 [Spirochaetaceae bacterium]|jgi:uncharacterized protein YPO0396|nr:hypothetical protein [Spirochaetaceae bacterium]
MLTLDRVRLVNWHNFDDITINIGNRCLLAGDNGSGKSTVIDAIQYAMVTDLRKAKFNVAAGERRGSGRDLLGYVRCKLGSEETEYRRGDTVTHVILEFSKNENTFLAGVCVEAWHDNSYKEHFWIWDYKNTNSEPRQPREQIIQSIPVRNENNIPFNWRQFVGALRAMPLKNDNDVIVFESKFLYIREFTNRLGVWKKHGDFNPYLEALSRSVGFSQITSVDRFVCDYILEENLVPIADMKENLESYKEAERQAKAASEKIAALKKICATADEWQKYTLLILKQEYLRLRTEKEIELQHEAAEQKRLSETQHHLEFITRTIKTTENNKHETERERRDTEAALAANDAHRLYQSIQDRLERLESDRKRESERATRFNNLANQCEAILGRPLLIENLDEEARIIDAEEKKYRQMQFEAEQQKNEIAKELNTLRAELAELERGRLTFPEAPVALRKMLEDSGISAHFLAEVAEVTDPKWEDAIEGWLNTRRFALLVAPDDFQRALAIYDGLPRKVAGALLPNLDKMRNENKKRANNGVKPGSLAELVSAKGKYGEIYLDYILGDIICATIDSLKNYSTAVTADCMTYSNHTAGRIKEEVYKRHYLGEAAKERRKNELQNEIQDKDTLHSKYTQEKKDAEEKSRAFSNLAHTLPLMKDLFPALALLEQIEKTIASAQEELAKIDTASFKELETKIAFLQTELQKQEDELHKHLQEQGRLEQTLSTCKDNLSTITVRLSEKDDALKSFAENNPNTIIDCEKYAEEKLKEETLKDLSDSKKQEATRKGIQTRTDNLRAEYGRLVAAYDREFNFYLSLEPNQNEEAAAMLQRLEISELPLYEERIRNARLDAEKEFRDHFVSRLNEQIVEANNSFNEINDILKTLRFGNDQYEFKLDELPDKKAQIEVIRKAAEIPSTEDGLFSQLEGGELEAANNLLDEILSTDIDSRRMREICDYRTYFHYDIHTTENDNIDEKTGKAARISLTKNLREKSGGETQTPYYVAIAASFYRFYKAHPEDTIRLVIFDEAFNRMDDERIGKILQFYRDLNLQIITSVPPEKIESILPWMDQVNIITRLGSGVRVFGCLAKEFSHELH